MSAVDVVDRTDQYQSDPAVFRPEIEVTGTSTLVLCEQVTAVDPERLGDFVGLLSGDELNRISEALRLVLDL